ncbi:MAG TPA: hypothetical protein VG347_13370, partial [Verrucomicrobiae bacterium]|nr:hypothetical protein [Verrucomicrobiae bacterium]
RSLPRKVCDIPRFPNQKKERGGQANEEFRMQNEETGAKRKAETGYGFVQTIQGRGRGTGDWKVASTGRLESLPYVRACTARFVFLVCVKSRKLSPCQDS